MEKKTNALENIIKININTQIIRYKTITVTKSSTVWRNMRWRDSILSTVYTASSQHNKLLIERMYVCVCIYITKEQEK